MNRIGMILLVTLLGACTREPSPATQMPTTAQWDGATAQEVRAQVEKTMGAFAAMDLEAFKAALTEDVVAFEMDLEGKPVRLGSRNDVVRYAEETFAELNNMGATLNLDFHSNNCRATPMVAYCTVEFDFKAKMTDGSTMVQPSRNSVVLRKGDDGWKWTHWHSSLSALPAQASPPASKPS